MGRYHILNPNGQFLGMTQGWLNDFSEASEWTSPSQASRVAAQAADAHQVDARVVRDYGLESERLVVLVGPRKLADLVVIYTTAPAGFDWLGTEELSACVGRTLRNNAPPVRKVRCPEKRVQAQRERYHSGAVYLVADEAEFEKLVNNNLVVLEEGK